MDWTSRSSASRCIRQPSARSTSREHQERFGGLAAGLTASGDPPQGATDERARGDGNRTETLDTRRDSCCRARAGWITSRRGLRGGLCGQEQRGPCAAGAHRGARRPRGSREPESGSRYTGRTRSAREPWCTREPRCTRESRPTAGRTRWVCGEKGRWHDHDLHRHNDDHQPHDDHQAPRRAQVVFTACGPHRAVRE
jgi:hypothetical protein